MSHLCLRRHLDALVAGRQAYGAVGHDQPFFRLTRPRPVLTSRAPPGRGLRAYSVPGMRCGAAPITDSRAKIVTTVVAVPATHTALGSIRRARVFLVAQRAATT